MKVFTITTSDLLTYRSVDFLHMCEACPNYGRLWSCPPITDDISTLLPDPVSYCAIEYAADTRERTRLKARLDTELSEKYMRVFSAGGCERCDKCKRITGEVCDSFLYSAEVLCLDMSQLYRRFMNEPLDKSGYSLIYVMQGKK